MNKYTFKFSDNQQTLFQRILARLEPSDYNIIKPVEPVDPKNLRGDYTTEIEMDAQSALTFRLGMKSVNIRRERTEEELAAEKARIGNHVITVRVGVN